jgi:hypothetical protein
MAMPFTAAMIGFSRSKREVNPAKPEGGVGPRWPAA